jgi:GGDEF domain-containing protein
MFPHAPEPREDFSFTASRDPRNFSKEFARRAKRLGFEDFRLHHLRGTHATLLLDRNVPVHTVAERIGDDPAVLLRNYAKRMRNNTADNSVSAQIEALAAGKAVMVLSAGALLERPELIDLAKAVGREVTGEDILSLSVGQSRYPGDGLDAEQLLAEADRRMYVVKQDHHRETGQAAHAAGSASS